MSRLEEKIKNLQNYKHKHSELKALAVRERLDKSFLTYSNELKLNTQSLTGKNAFKITKKLNED